MATFEVTSPEGKKYRVNAPEGSTQQDAIKYVQTHQSDLMPHVEGKQPHTMFGDAAETVKSVPGAIGSEFMEGAKLGSEGLTQGAATLKSMGNPWNPLNQAKMLPSALKTVAGGLQELASPITGTAKALVGDPIRAQAPNNFAMQLLGNTSELLASMFGPGIASKMGTELGKFLPQLTKSAKLLMDEGVDLTMGHMANRESATGKIIKGGEDKAASFPFFGGVVRTAQERMIGDFNKAVVNRSLRLIGDKVPADVKAGPELMAYGQRAIGSRYNALMPQLVWGMDAQLDADLTRLVQRNPMVPEAQQNQFNAIVADIRGRMSVSPPTSKLFKEIESEVTRLARDNMNSDLAMEKQFGKLLDNLNGTLRQSLARVNPIHAQELETLNSAWAMFKRAEGAATRRKASGQRFMPSDLLQEISSETSQSAFARGDGLLQDLAQAGQDVLPQETPNSGTLDRWAWWGLMSGASPISPHAAVGMLAGTAPYTRPGQRAINTLVRSKPFASTNRAIGQSGGPFAGIADLLSQQENQ